MRSLPGLRSLLFKVIAISLPLILLVLVELILRLSGYGNQYPLFIEVPQQPGLQRINPDIAHRYFLNPEAAPNVSFPFFKKEKTDKTVRIVVQGASSALGIPYMHGGSFPSMLEQRIRHSIPGAEVEVINTAITAVNSYTLLDLADEIAEIEPDAVVIYAGHNEYYGALGVGSTQLMVKGGIIKYVYMVFDDLRLFQLLKNIQKSVARKRTGDVLLNPDKTLMERMVARQSIPFDSEMYHAGISQFKRNLNKIISIYQKQDIPVFIGTLVCNMKDLEPFISEGSDPEAGSVNDASDIINLAETEKMNAMAQFQAGKIYLMRNDFEKAQEMFLLARDLDQLRFRAPSEMNKVILNHADSKRIKLVDLDSVFKANSPNGIIGNELLTEHVHPNAYGYFLMADAFYNAMVDSKVISISNEISFEKAFKMIPVTRVDSVYAFLGISLLTNSWPFSDRKANMDSILASSSSESRIDSLGWLVFNKKLDWTEAINEYYKNCINSGNLKEALRASEAMKLEFRYSGIPYNMSARTYGQMEETGKAIEELRTGFDMEPLPEIAYNLSGYLLKDGYLKESAEYLEYAIQGNQSFGHANEKLKVLKSSIEMEERLILDSTNVSLMISLARNLVFLNQKSKANQLIRKAILTDPSHPEVLKMLSR